MAWLVTGSALLTLLVFVRDVTGRYATAWDWLRVVAPVLLAFSIFLLVRAVRRTRP